MLVCYASIARSCARWLAAIVVFSLSLGLGTADAEKRVALVIGNSAYAHLAPLNNPHRDAEAVADLLKSLGWDVIKGINLTFVELYDAVAKLEGKASGAELALVYYAGHGMSHQNCDFLAPTDMPEHCADDALLRRHSSGAFLSGRGKGLNARLCSWMRAAINRFRIAPSAELRAASAAWRACRAPAC